MFPASSNPKNTPIIIVGGGLAGSILAWSFIQQGINILLYADDKACASRVAAGLINPVTGQRFVLAEHTPDMLSFAKAFYHNIEQNLGINCFFEKPMKRLFLSEKECINCKKRLKNDNYANFLKEETPPQTLNAEHSGITQTQTAWLDTNTLLDALHQYFEQHDCITYANFSNHNTEQHVIYCEGYHMQRNPLFSWLPLQPAHGEIITCKTDKPLPDYIINKGKWLLPMSEHQCRIGATYETDLDTPTVQATSKQQLLTFAGGIFTKPHSFEVIKHQAGIRPATLDKQPFIGTHPKYNNLHIFNGFGSRGSLMIPWYANQFCNHNIPVAANISRYHHFMTSTGESTT